MMRIKLTYEGRESLKAALCDQDADAEGYRPLLLSYGSAIAAQVINVAVGYKILTQTTALNSSNVSLDQAAVDSATGAAIMLPLEFILFTCWCNSAEENSEDSPFWAAMLCNSKLTCSFAPSLCQLIYGTAVVAGYSAMYAVFGSVVHSSLDAATLILLAASAAVGAAIMVGAVSILRFGCGVSATGQLHVFPPSDYYQIECCPVPNCPEVVSNCPDVRLPNVPCPEGNILPAFKMRKQRSYEAQDGRPTPFSSASLQGTATSIPTAEVVSLEQLRLELAAADGQQAGAPAAESGMKRTLAVV